jgi:hypothetical protein
MTPTDEPVEQAAMIRVGDLGRPVLAPGLESDQLLVPCGQQAMLG